MSRFKQKLNMSDLCSPAEKSFEMAVKVMPDMFQWLRESNPGVDREWRNHFAKMLEVVEAQHTRECQAAECRRLILVNIEAEQGSLSAFLDAETPEILRMCFKEGSTESMSDEGLRRYAGEMMCMRAVDSIGLNEVYRTHFDNTLPRRSFKEDYREMCRILAGFALAGHGYRLVASLEEEKPDGWDTFQLDVVFPAADELVAIKNAFYQNLLLLSPKKPDVKPFIDFKNGTMKKIKGWTSYSQEPCRDLVK